MSCFDDLFAKSKKDLKILIKEMSKSKGQNIAVSRLNRQELLCMFFALSGYIPLNKPEQKRKNMWGNRHWNMYGDRPEMRPLTNEQQYANDLALEKYGYKTQKDFIPLEEDYIYGNIDEDYVPPPKNKHRKKQMSDEIDEPYFKSDYKKDKAHYNSFYDSLGYKIDGKYKPKLYKALSDNGYIQKGEKPSDIERVLEKFMYEKVLNSPRDSKEKERFGNFLKYKYGEINL
jgi:hypothetical protein